MNRKAAKKRALISLVLVSWMGFCLETIQQAGATPSATLYRQELGDTLDASPWIDAFFTTWDSTSQHLLCLTSFAQWPRFYYLRHLSRPSQTPPFCPPGSPILLQLPTCPDRIPTLSTFTPWAIVQCGPRSLRVYSPESIRRNTGET